MKTSPETPDSPNADRSRFALIFPVCNEEACLGMVLEELERELSALRGLGWSFDVAVGLNGSSDRSDEIAQKAGAIVGETETRGYGHGCMAAIEAVKAAGEQPDAYIFLSGDGANDPRELRDLIAGYRAGADLVIGTRTTQGSNWTRPWIRSLANVMLGWWATWLSGQRYTDLGPYRVIDRGLFERLNMQEWTWGWTIEPQILAPKLGARVVEIPVRERPRMAGEQKISGVSLRHSLGIGLAIARAGWRVSRRKISSQGVDS